MLKAHQIESKLARFEQHFAQFGHLLGAVEYRRSGRTIAAAKKRLHFMAGQRNKLIEFRKEITREYIRKYLMPTAA